MSDGDPDNHPNTAFVGTPADEDWIEVFHSRRSWATTQISFSADDAPWVPFGKFELIDASAIKAGFRVFRIRARKLQLKLADGRCGETDTDGDEGYKIGQPGRYVIESGCRRVSDAQLADCVQATRPRDRYIELMFRPTRAWRTCFVTYAVCDGDVDNAVARADADWFMVPMTRAALRDGCWAATVQARRGIDCAFTDGGDEWESNCSKNFLIRVPGRYTVEGGKLSYGGVSALDLHVR